MVRSLQRGTETGEGLSFLNKAPVGVGGSSPVIVKTIFVILGCTAILIPVQAQSTVSVGALQRRVICMMLTQISSEHIVSETIIVMLYALNNVNVKLF